MSLFLSTSAAAAGLSNAERYNTAYDITWSIQYCMFGSLSAQGGFCAFLYDATSLMPGGLGKSLGFAPSQGYTGFANISGVSGALIGIGFDSTGLFATSGNGLTTGLLSSQAIPNSVTIRTGTSFTYLTSFAISSVDSNFTLIKSTSAEFEQFRFRLTDMSNTIEISRWYNDEYITWCTIPISLNLPLSSMCYSGFSFSSPLCGNADYARFGIAHIHTEGGKTAPQPQTKDVEIVCTLPIISNITTALPAPKTIVADIEELGPQYTVYETVSTIINPCDIDIVPNIRCGETISYSGERGTQYYYIDAGERTGEFTIIYNAYDIPDRFTLFWNDSSATSCFVGSSSYNSQLSAIGYGPVAGPGYGTLKINKTTALPRTVALQVEAPLEGTAWDVQVLCIPEPAPELRLFKTQTISNSTRVQNNGSVNIGTLTLGQSAIQYFTIQNYGDADLSSFSLVQFISSSFAQYRISNPITAAQIAPDGTAVFGITFNPSITGHNNTRFALYSNDMNMSPLTFNLSAYVIAGTASLCACNSNIEYTGAPGIFVYNINYGTDTGNIVVDYEAFTIPDRFTLYWNGVSATSGFVGSSSYNSALTAIGYPVISSTTSTGTLTIAKTDSQPTYATLVVDAPLPSTAWNVSLQCIGEPTTTTTTTPPPTTTTTPPPTTTTPPPTTTTPPPTTTTPPPTTTTTPPPTTTTTPPPTTTTTPPPTTTTTTPPPTTTTTTPPPTTTTTTPAP